MRLYFTTTPRRLIASFWRKLDFRYQNNLKKSPEDWKANEKIGHISQTKTSRKRFCLPYLPRDEVCVRSQATAVSRALSSEHNKSDPEISKRSQHNQQFPFQKTKQTRTEDFIFSHFHANYILYWRKTDPERR